MIEGILASGFGVRTPVSEKYAFTTNLIERLRDSCTKGVTASGLHHDLTQKLKNSQSNNSRQQASHPHYIRPAELPGEFRTIELKRADSFVTAPSTMTAPSIRLQPLDSGSCGVNSRRVAKGPERPAIEAFTARGIILEVIGQSQGHEEFDVPGNTGNKFVHFKDPETATISDSTTIRHSVLCNYPNASEGDEVPSNPQPIDGERMAHPITMADIIAANQQSNQKFLVEGGPVPKRLQIELRQESKTLTSYSDMCTYTPLFENAYELIATIKGPYDTVYEGGLFHIRILLCEEYPWKPGTWAFVTKVYHPNIGPDGSICVDMLGDGWSPTRYISQTLLSLASFLGTPEASDPHPDCLDIASEYLNNRARFDKTAIAWTRAYATGDITSENKTTAFQKEA